MTATGIRRHGRRLISGVFVLALIGLTAASAGAGQLTFSRDGYQTVSDGDFVRPGPIITGLDGKIYVAEFWFFGGLQSVQLGGYDPLTGEVTHVALPVTGPSDFPTSLTQLGDGTFLVSSVNSFPGTLIVVPPGGSPTSVAVSGIERGPATVYWHRGTGRLLATDVFVDTVYELTPAPGGYTATPAYQSSLDLEISNGITEVASDPAAAYLLTVGGVDRVALTSGGWMATASYSFGQEMSGVVGVADGRILGVTGSQVLSVSVPSGEVAEVLTISGIQCSASFPGITVTDGDSRLWGVAVSDCNTLEQLATSGKIWTGPLAPPVIAVTIDVHPGSSPNSINPKSHGVTPVAILTTDTFDAGTADPSTVRFGAAGIEAAAVHVAYEDVNGDGRLDLVLQFSTQSTGIACGATAASLTGKTTGGLAFSGSDSIRTVNCQ